jgi:flagellar basal body-associated protein FliL
MPDSPLPPDPEAYDEERNAHARKRGLSAPYIAGGRDPDPEAGLAEERRYLRWLIIMVVVLVLAAVAVGIVAALLGYSVE